MSATKQSKQPKARKPRRSRGEREKSCRKLHARDRRDAEAFDLQAGSGIRQAYRRRPLKDRPQRLGRAAPASCRPRP
jgi:hypothetical protein